MTMSAHSMRHLGDVVGEVVNRLEQQIFSKRESQRPDDLRVPNDPRQEWMFACLRGKEPGGQKRLILQGRHPSVRFLTDAEADILISALGLEEA